MLFARTKWLVGAFLAVLFASSTAAGADLPPLTHGMTAVPGSPAAAPLRLPDIDGEAVDIEAFRGKVVVVNFWATWCPPCRREMPSLERLYQAVGPEHLSVLAVNIGEDIDTVFSFFGMVDPAPTFPVLLDREAKSLEAWSVKGLPTTFIVGPQGQIRYRAVGGREFDHPEIIDQIRQLREARSE